MEGWNQVCFAKFQTAQQTDAQEWNNCTGDMKLRLSQIYAEPYFRAGMDLSRSLLESLLVTIPSFSLCSPSADFFALRIRPG